MSDTARPSSAALRLSEFTKEAPAIDSGVAEANFIAKVSNPDEGKRLVLDALDQMYANNALGLFLDPTADAYRLALQTIDSPSELGTLPKAIGRLMIEAVQREATLHMTSDNPVSGKFFDGILNIGFKSGERRLRVLMIPTAHGVSMTLRVIPNLPADTGDLAALGLADDQANLIEECLKATGVVLLGGPDPQAMTMSIGVMLSKAFFLGRRVAIVAASRGSDVANVTRIEAGTGDQQQAHVILAAAEAGINCIGLEQPAGPLTSQAAATAALKYQAAVLLPVTGRNAIECIGKYLSPDMPASLRYSVIAATCQIQLPILCPNCARWGEVAADDIKFFDIKDPKFGSNVRFGCERCNSQIQEFSNLFELLAVPETVTTQLRQETTFQSIQSELKSAPGYVPLMKMIVKSVVDGRCSLNEARQYYQWQIPTEMARVK
jgi:type II secretory ATPase GspE/PulE/Tfp pilus assembly ATPase PilB-like protein